MPSPLLISFLACRLGAGAVDQLLAGKKGILIGMQREGIAATPVAEIIGRKKSLDAELFHPARSLAK